MSDRTLPATIVTPTSVTLTSTDGAAVHGFALAREIGGDPARLQVRLLMSVGDRGYASAQGRGLDLVFGLIGEECGHRGGRCGHLLETAVSTPGCEHVEDLAGLPSPVAAKFVRVVLGGIRRDKKASPAKRRPQLQSGLPRCLRQSRPTPGAASETGRC